MAGAREAQRARGGVGESGRGREGVGVGGSGSGRELEGEERWRGRTWRSGAARGMARGRRRVAQGAWAMTSRLARSWLRLASRSLISFWRRPISRSLPHHRQHKQRRDHQRGGNARLRNYFACQLSLRQISAALDAPPKVPLTEQVLKTIVAPHKNPDARSNSGRADTRGTLGSILHGTFSCYSTEALRNFGAMRGPVLRTHTARGSRRRVYLALSSLCADVSSRSSSYNLRNLAKKARSALPPSDAAMGGFGAK